MKCSAYNLKLCIVVLLTVHLFVMKFQAEGQPQLTTTSMWRQTLWKCTIRPSICINHIWHSPTPPRCLAGPCHQTAAIMNSTLVFSAAFNVNNPRFHSATFDRKWRALLTPNAPLITDIVNAAIYWPIMDLTAILCFSQDTIKMAVSTVTSPISEVSFWSLKMRISAILVSKTKMSVIWARVGLTVKPHVRGFQVDLNHLRFYSMKAACMFNTVPFFSVNVRMKKSPFLNIYMYCKCFTVCAINDFSASMFSSAFIESLT